MDSKHVFPALCVIQVSMFHNMKTSNKEAIFAEIKKCVMVSTGLGVRIKRSCTRSADTVCEPLEGFYSIEQNKGSCTYAVQHSECHPGQYIIQAGG